jgi:hypothetical protein
VQGAEDKVTGFSRFNRDVNGFQIAHFADEDNVRVFAQGRDQSTLEALSMHMHLALIDEALVVVVHEFNRIFNGDDVLFAVLLM